MESATVSDHRVGGTRDGHRGAIGGAWPDPDSATRCQSATWEISYVPYTCVTFRLHVRLHTMETATVQVGPSGRGFRAARHPDDGLARLYGADARRWLTVTRLGEREKAPNPLGRPSRGGERIVFGPPRLRDTRAERLRRGMDRARLGLRRRLYPASWGRTSLAAAVPGAPAERGRVSRWRTPVRRVESARLRARPTSMSDAAKAGKPAYSLGPHSVRPLRRLAGGCAPCDPPIANGAP